MNDASWARMPIEPQTVDAPLSRSAVFLTVTIAEDDTSWNTVRGVLADLGALVRAVGFRDLAGRLSCVAGIGSEAWDRLTRMPRPAQLRPFVPVHGDVHTAPSTPGDVFFHIRAEREDMCFELERILLEKLGTAVRVVDETVGFRYFDSRDLLGFVDGTENPTGEGMREWTLVTDEAAELAGGSYIVVQKYLHDLATWAGIPVEVQQHIIGRSKSDNLELDDVDRPSHRSLATIVDDGVEHDILRDNMPFGRPGHQEFGTYFIGYSRDLWVIERMLQRMFVGEPAGSYDRILDVSRAVTGTTFFAPPLSLLEALE